MSCLIIFVLSMISTPSHLDIIRANMSFDFEYTLEYCIRLITLVHYFSVSVTLFFGFLQSNYLFLYRLFDPNNFLEQFRICLFLLHDWFEISVLFLFLLYLCLSNAFEMLLSNFVVDIFSIELFTFLGLLTSIEPCSYLLYPWLPIFHHC